jgi:hypothetical protein
MYGKNKRRYIHINRKRIYTYIRKEDVHIPQVLDARAPADKDEAA